MSDPAPPLEHPDAPDLFRGGLLYRIQHRFGVEPYEAARVARRASLVGLLLWLPMAVASIVDGRALPGHVGVPFFLDVAAYVRPLLVVPLMLIAEPMLAAAWRTVGGKFRSRGIVGPDARAGYDAQVDRGERTARRLVPELVCLGLAAALAFRLVSVVMGGSHDAWYATGVGATGSSRMTPAGLWHAFAVHGALFYLTLRWLWLLAVWYRFLFAVARLPLRLLPAHPDRAAGLGFVGKSIVAAAPLVVAWSAALTSVAANHMIHRSWRLPEFAALGGVFLVFVLLVFVLPPALAFLPLLVRTRREALEVWSGRMARSTEGRPADGPGTGGAVEVGAPELGLEDLSIAVSAVKAMLPVPIAIGSLIALVAASCVPVVPLLFIAFPAAEIFHKLMQLVI